MKEHFRRFAAYNQWANRRVYGAAAALTDEQRKRPVGLFFGSVHGTLNHLLVADRIWLGRLTGVDEETGPLSKTLHERFANLLDARLAEDARLVAAVEAWPESAFVGQLSYKTTSGVPFTQPLAEVLSHVFNHQTHHRSQANSGLLILTGQEPDGLDLLLFQRGQPVPSEDQLRAAAAASG